MVMFERLNESRENGEPSPLLIAQPFINMAHSVAASGLSIQPGYIVGPLVKSDKYTDVFKATAPKELIMNDILYAPGCTRRWIEKRPLSGDRWKASSTKFTINVESKTQVDMSQCWLHFEASCSASDGTDAFFTNGMWNIFRQVIIKSGGVTLLDMTDKHVFESMNYAFCRSPTFDSTLAFDMMGVGPISRRKTRAKGAKYAIPINIPLLTSEQIILAKSPALEIEFFLAQPNTVVCADNGTTNPNATFDYEIKNVYLRFWETEYEPAIQDTLVSTAPIYYPFVNFTAYTPVVQTGTRKFQYTIPNRNQSLIRLIVKQIPTRCIDNPFEPDALTTIFEHGGVNNFQAVINNRMIPQVPISAGGDKGPAEAFIEMMLCMDRAELARMDVHSDQNNGTHVFKNLNRLNVNIDEFVTNKFLMCMDFKSTHDNMPNYIVNFSMASANETMMLNIEYDNAKPSENMTLFVFVVFLAMARFDGDRWIYMD